MKRLFRSLLSLPMVWSLVMTCLTPSLSWAWGYMEGFVRTVGGQPIAGAKVTSPQGYVSTTLADGSFFMGHAAGTFTFTASEEGYQSQAVSVTITNLATKNQNFNLTIIPIRIDNVTPNWGEMDSDLAVSIQGAGFDQFSRLTMAPATGNPNKILGTLTSQGPAQAVSVAGNMAYVAFGDAMAGGNKGLQVIDVSVPGQMQSLGSLATTGYPLAVTVVGTTAYVAEDFYGLRVIDVSNPTSPNTIAVVNTLGAVQDVEVVGSIAYVVDGYTSFKIIDVSDPGHAALIGSLPVNYCAGVKVIGSTAYLASSGRLTLVDVGDPTHPALLGTVDTPGWGGRVQVEVSGNKAYVANGTNLVLVDVSVPQHPVVTASVATTMGKASGVSVVGSTVYVADGESGIEVFDVSDPSHPRPNGYVETPGFASDITVLGTTAYVADGTSGLQVIDVDDISKEVIRSINTPGVAKELAVVGNTVFVADDDWGTMAIDVSDPDRMSIIGENINFDPSIQLARDITVVGNTAYVANMDSLRLIDVSNPAQLNQMGEVRMFYYTINGFFLSSYGVAVSGNTAYVVGSSSLVTIDIDPISPTYLTITNDFLFSFEDFMQDITIVGSTAYIAAGPGGLIVFDLKPWDMFYNPFFGRIRTPGFPVDVAVDGNRAYVADGSSGLQVIDVSDPSSPVIIGSIDTPGNAQGVTVVGSTAYVADGDAGLQAIDVSDPAHLVIIATIDTPGYTNSVKVVGNQAYLADGDAGLIIVPLPVEIKPVSVVNNSEIGAVLPKPQEAGNYTLRVFNANQSDELSGAVTFSDHRAKQKAIIVAGYGPDPSNWLWQETKRNAHYAYNTLLWQGYLKENIFLLSAENVDADYNGRADDVDGDATLVNLENAITVWARDADEVLLYMVDHGGQKTFEIKHSAGSVEILEADTLASWLNTLQSSMLGRVIVMNESCYSGSFVAPLKVPPGSPIKRVVMTSSKADEKTKFQQGGKLSFAYQFWSSIFEGVKLTKAFNDASVMMKTVQTAWLDGNGDGVANTYNEGDLSGIVIGRGVKSAPGAPMINAVAEPQVLSGGGTSATLWAGEVVSLNPISKAWAVIVPPDYDPSAPDSADDLLPTVELTLTGSGPDKRYEASYNGFTSYGVYTVAYYVMDDKETISQPMSSVVTQRAGADAFEPDDSAAQAGTISLNVATPQAHTFQDANDTDWLKFQAIMGEDYMIEARNLGVNNDVVIELYGPDRTTRLDSAYTLGEPRADEFLDWVCPQTGVYYVKFFTVNGLYGPGTEYEASITRNVGPGFGILKGTILDSLTLKPIAGASLISSDGASDLTGPNGFYELVGEAGNATLTVRASGYGDKAQTVQIPANSEAILSIPLTPLNIPNRAPTAQAGPDRMATGSVSLDAGGSTDPEGEAMTYTWTLTHRTDTAGNRSAGGVSPTVNDLVPGFYDVTLTVTDSEGLTASDSLVLVAAGGGFTQAQLDQAVAAAEAAKNAVIGEKDQTISQLAQQLAAQDQTLAANALLLNRLCTSQDLGVGFNLVGFACPPEGYTAHQFLDALGAAKVVSIQKFDDTAGAFATAAFNQSGQVAGPDFPLIPGQGYIISMKQAVQDLRP